MVAEIDRPTRTATPSAASSRSSSHGLPPGLGSHVHWDRRLDARLAGALMGIQAIKGVEVGDGFELARDAAARWRTTRSSPTDEGVRRVTGRAGGTEGGMTTGELLRVRAAMKPIATVPRALRTVDVATGEATAAHHQRSDVCAVPAAGIVAEAMVALVLADAVLEKFGGDSVGETRRNVAAYLDEPELPVTAAGRSSSWSARTGAGKTTVGALLAERSGVAVRDTDADVEATRGPRRSATSSSTAARRVFRALERDAVADGAGRPRRRPGARRRRGPGPGDPRAARRPPGGASSTSGSPTPSSAVGLDSRPAAAAGQPARPAEGAAGRAPPRSTTRSPPFTVDTDDRTPTRSSTPRS